MSVPPTETSTTTPFPWPVRSYPGKRLLDIAVALAALIIAGPVMVLVAMLVKLTSPGPVFYRGVRAGLGGRAFGQWKVRTMRWKTRGDNFTRRDDPRVTSIGKFLRLFKIDELPQLINVLRGEMSVIGPRPEVLPVVEDCYTQEQLRVLSARPGLTGQVQIRAFPDLSNTIPDGADPERYYRTTVLPARLKEDLQYVDSMSLIMDVKLILQTVYCVLIKSWLVLLRQRGVRKTR
ncbi:MAG TPA: sugar transferase [Thermoguttaceae bacterium]|nr:sugar transferase [Thermoguttaceae bacterium]